MILQVKDLYASYSGHKVLSGASIYINPSEIVGLCGPNKAGKSTLGKCLAGIKNIDGGDILFNGKSITRLTTSQRISIGLSLCPERSNEEREPSLVYLNQTVEFNLELMRKGIARNVWAQRLDQVLTYFDDFDDIKLSQRMKQLAKTLSGGQAQILGIVRKLLPLLNSDNNPKLLIIDEPFRGLAPKTISSLFRALEQTRQKANVSILLLEEMPIRLSCVDRSYILSNGTTRELQLIDLINGTSVTDMFFGQPDDEHLPSSAR